MVESTSPIDPSAPITTDEELSRELPIGPAPEIRKVEDVIAVLARAHELAQLSASLCFAEVIDTERCCAFAAHASWEASLLTMNAWQALHTGECSRLEARSMPQRLCEANAVLAEIAERGSEDDRLNTTGELVRGVISPLREALSAEAGDHAA